ncbi:type II toxin-antitoxin system VapC family toxin [Humibacter sp. BT305]|nr:type II toxin-antitoxin system VapC family toxin [Humibacter sp. BT305]
MIILDTNVVSEYSRSDCDRRVLRFVSAILLREVWITSITTAELLDGIALMPDGRRRRELSGITARVVEQELGGRVLAFDRLDSVEYASVRALRARAGRPIDVMDAQIAAIARRHRATLVTRNVRDFEGCGIEVVNPWE